MMKREKMRDRVGGNKQTQGLKQTQANRQIKNTRSDLLRVLPARPANS